MYTKKIFTQYGQHILNLFSSEQVNQFIRRVIYMGSLLSLSVYAWVRLMFHDFPFEIVEETGLILRTLLAGWIMAAVCIGGFQLILFVADNYAQLSKRCLAFTGTLFNSMRKSVSIRTESNATSKRVTIESPEMIMRF
ncbi:MAG: hypothetical protein ABIR15_22970 [Chitinophagaceae bacterium]